jgi:hypothetical protein
LTICPLGSANRAFRIKRVPALMTTTGLTDACSTIHRENVPLKLPTCSFCIGQQVLEVDAKISHAPLRSLAYI